MGAVLSGGIEGVSARYAAQIRELLHVQAMKRLAAEQEAARRAIEAQEAARLEALRTRAAAMTEMKEPVKVDVEPAAAELAEPIQMAEASEPAPVPPAQIFDEQA
ncbi:MAG TPA: hypothetical protein VIA80_16655 [Hyphomonadaceae bacterium]|jgi:hypothetical protein